MWTIGELKQRGKFSFQSNYWRCVLVAFILTLFTAASSATAANSNAGDVSLWSAIKQTSLSTGISAAAIFAVIASIIGVGMVMGFVIKFFLSWPLEVGCRGFFLENLRGYQPVGTIADAFKISYIRNALTMLIANLIIGIGFVLFVIPGVILSYSFRMVPYILRDNPDLTFGEVINESRRLMTGNKWHTFLLDLSFIGWYLLSTITLGLVGVFYLNPYKAATDAALYERIRTNSF